MENEIWKDIEGWEGAYQVSSIGRVRSLDKKISHWRGGDRLIKGRILTPKLRKGYLGVNLSKKDTNVNACIHRLVALHFIPNPENKPQTNHKNGIKTDNRVENLEWATPSENTQHAYDNKLINVAFGEKHGHSKLKDEDVLAIKRLIKIGSMTHKEIGNVFNVSDSSIDLIKAGKTWKHL